jgi:2-polyprenyl-3-methyl-5-hydroxy-6-metoxy-1,4-benzoquinol methylase
MEINQHNKETWNAGAYQAWINRLGTPEEAAIKLKSDPIKRIGPIYKHFGTDIRGKKIMNLLGSNGNKAVAFALLGASMTIVDFSIDNERYASELAKEAGVPIRYILADVLQLPEEELQGQYDFVLMENGILHYFQQLEPLFHIVSSLLCKGGKLVLQDFHPVSTKLITSKGTTANIRKHKVTGDYFDTSLQEKDVSFLKYLPMESADHNECKVHLREWTLGEIITSIAAEGLYIRTLEELPNLSSDVFDKGIPKTYIAVAEKH